MPGLFWLPVQPGWQEQIGTVSALDGEEAWKKLVELAGARLEFPETITLDRLCQKMFGQSQPPSGATRAIRLAVLSSSTSEHLAPGLRVGALRRGLWLSVYTTAYGQYMQELADSNSGLHRFKPTAVLLAFDPMTIFAAATPSLDQASADVLFDAAEERLKDLWRKLRAAFGCEIYQQTLLPQAPPLAGDNEHKLPGSLYRLCRRLNERLRAVADGERVNLAALDDWAMRDGMDAWHGPVYWLKAKQEIAPLATPLYGDKIARLLAAAQGRSFKCLVLDLDNTLWGGVIGDDGLEGIKIGQGSALGEAYLAFQRYALDLSRRGVILAVCSKNDEANAILPFERHPDMLLRRSNIACFVANWHDKAANLRMIAERLNIGLDSLVFADDNPFERNIVRRELPMVAVPELPEDPAFRVPCLAAAGYFEALSVTDEDLNRAEQYQANLKREDLKVSSTDLNGYLKSLEMELHASAFDRLNMSRIVQLINKTNQFNLTTRRYSEADISALLDDPSVVTLQLRLTDHFGDNGVIGTLICRAQPDGDFVIDTWLMSCRVLGRGVENAMLNLIAQEAAKFGARRLVGEYIPTAKNGMVSDHYSNLGFERIAIKGEPASTSWALPIAKLQQQ